MGPYISCLYIGISEKGCGQCRRERRTVKCSSLGCCFVYRRMVWQRKVIVIGGGIKDTKLKALERETDEVGVINRFIYRWNAN